MSNYGISFGHDADCDYVQKTTLLVAHEKADKTTRKTDGNLKLLSGKINMTKNDK